jgi:multidrug efflux pump subunit AcrB
MNLPKTAIRNSQFILIVILIGLFLGVQSFVGMPRSEDPVLELPVYALTVIYPGTSPADMEDLVVDPLEEAIDQVDDITEVLTEIKDGLAVLRIEGSFDIDADEKFDDLVREVNLVRPNLPDGIFDIIVRQVKPENSNVAHLFVLSSDEASYAQMRDVAERFEDRLEKIDALKEVEIEAAPEEEIRVSLAFQRMANQQISLQQVIGTLQANNVNIPGGDISSHSKNFSIKSTGSYENLEEIRQTVISTANGNLVHLEDIAEVEMDYEDSRWIARYEQQKSIFIGLKVKQGINVLQVSEEIKSTEAAFLAELPASMHLHTAFEQAPAVAERIDGFFMNLLQGVALVGFIILLFLGWRASIIIMTIIPLCIVIALALLNGAGYALQQVSIAALVIAFGLLVDNGIVVIENINRFLKQGMSRKDAAAKGAGEVGWAIVSSTATTLLAFFPLSQLGEGAGLYLRSLPVTVMLTLTISLILALTLSPILASWIMKKSGKEEKPYFMDRIIDRIIASTYRPTLNFALKRGWVVVVAALGLLVFSVSLFPKIGVSFFPTADKPLLLIEVETPDGSDLDETDKAVQFVENVLDSTDFVKNYTANIGHDNPQIYYNRVPESFTQNRGQVLVNFEDWDPQRFYRTLGDLRLAFADYANARITFSELKNGAPAKAPVEIRIIGDELDTLKQLAAQVADVLTSTEGLIDIDNPLSIDKTELKLALNKEKAGLMGMSYLDFDQGVRASLTGLRVDKVSMDDGEKYPLVVRMPFDEKQDISDFNKVYFATRTGGQIPLRQVADFKFQAASAEILHYNLDRHATVTASVIDADKTVPITQEVLQKLEEIDLPQGYSFYAAGEYENQQSAFGNLGIILLLAQVGIFAVLVLQFRSVLQPLVVFSAIPLAITGSFFALYLTGWSFSFFTFVGFISLVGIVVNNSIIMVDYINQLRKEGMELVEAVRLGSERRFTPIILTSITTILGLVPLTATASSLWSPLGWTIIGGMVSSTLLTLLIVPVLYRWFSQS